MQMWEMEYDFEDRRNTFNDLIRYHRRYVDSDYSFEEWLGDHIACGTIKPIVPGMGNRPEGRRMSESSRRQEYAPPVMRDSGGSRIGRTLFRELSEPANLRNMGKYDKDLRQYEALCQSYDSDKTEPRIKKRLAWYFRGNYHMFRQELIPAERAFREALAVYAPVETAALLPDEKIVFELLRIYYTQANFRRAEPLLKELLTVIDSGRANHGLSDDDIYCIYTMKCEIFENSLGKDDLKVLKNKLSEIHNDIKKRNFGELAGRSDKRWMFALISIMLLAGNHYASETECGKYQEILEYIIAYKELLLPGDEQQTLMWDAYELVLQELGLSEEVSVRERLKLVERGRMSADTIAETLTPIIAFYYKNGRRDEGERHLRDCLVRLGMAWRSRVRDINDIRLYRELGTVQLQFMECYSVLRRYTELSFAYEKVLQFKELASLAVRERNRIFHSNEMGKTLELSGAHNELSDREAERILRNEPAGVIDNEVYNRKLAADMEFYERFPKNAAYTKITWEKVQKAIPDNVAVIEYFFSDYDKYSAYRDEDIIDVYIIRKQKNSCALKKEVIPHGRAVLKEAKEWISVFQKESAGQSSFGQGIDWEGERRKEMLGRSLYRRLLEPVLSLVSGVRRIYIAPDRELINLPFELLKDNNGLRFGEEYTVVQMECARDFLFGSKDYVFARGSLIMGNPQNDIPFSKVEACLVAGQCASPCYTGSKAAKNLLLSAEGYRNIHIATHGYFDSRQDAAYASGLIFAGAENWLRTGQKDRTYGSGIVTADEISRLNLHSVELAVISSCYSGMNEILENKGFHGIIGGFSAAGARYVISSLWAADDFATTILMGYFYDAYMRKKEKPFAALKSAKQYIQKATIGQLERDGWFAYMLEQDIDYESRQYVLQYEKMDDWERPFENEIYWGGFICYRCN